MAKTAARDKVKTAKSVTRTADRRTKAVRSPSPKSLGDLRAAKYNPRVITDRQKTQLGESYRKFGDLSGIVYNVRTGTIVGGHQRTDIFRKASSSIRKASQAKDSQGTVGIGSVLVREKGGQTYSIPYREVDWDATTEMAANVAANSAGGEFDMVKLGRVLHALKHDKFEVESLPLDLWDIKRATSSFDQDRQRKAAGFGDKLEPIDIGNVAKQLKHVCPKCHFRF